MPQRNKEAEGPSAWDMVRWAPHELSLPPRLGLLSEQPSPGRTLEVDPADEKVGGP